QVLFTAASFGDLLSRYKYLYLVSRQDRLLANDMSKLQRRIARAPDAGRRTRRPGPPQERADRRAAALPRARAHARGLARGDPSQRAGSGGALVAAGARRERPERPDRRSRAGPARGRSARRSNRGRLD